MLYYLVVNGCTEKNCQTRLAHHTPTTKCSCDLGSISFIHTSEEVTKTSKVSHQIAIQSNPTHRSQEEKELLGGGPAGPQTRSRGLVNGDIDGLHVLACQYWDIAQVHTQCV